MSHTVSIDFGFIIVWLGLIAAFLGLCGLIFWGLIKNRPWLRKAVIAWLVTTPLLVLWTHHVRRVTFSEELRIAARQGDLPKARELLSWGADPNCSTEFGTALEAARESKNREMIQLLEDGAKR